MAIYNDAANAHYNSAPYILIVADYGSGSDVASMTVAMVAVVDAGEGTDLGQVLSSLMTIVDAAIGTDIAIPIVSVTGMD